MPKKKKKPTKPPKESLVTKQPKPPKVVYDELHGLLPLIRQYVWEEPAKKARRPRTSSEDGYYPPEEWEWPEAQVCSMCAHGGELLCCEKCPASFHILCIGLDEIPDGDYYCHRCSYLPSDFKLFKSEENKMNPQAKNRVSNEIQRNRETVAYHYDRLKAIQKSENSSTEVVFGPKNIDEALNNSVFDPCYIEALGMANPTHFSLPNEYYEQKEPYIGGRLVHRREKIFGEMCVECKKITELCVMLKCDFCGHLWHLECVTPTIYEFPGQIYWMCPRHIEHRIESIFGDQKTAAEKRKLALKHANIEPSFEIFAQFCEATRPLRRAAFLQRMLETINGTKSQLDKDNPVYFKPVEPQNEEIVEEPCTSEEKRNDALDTVPEASKADEIDSDDERDVKFTEEELIMSIMPLDEKRREEHLKAKLKGTDFEMSKKLALAHDGLVRTTRTIYNNFSEKDIIKMKRKSLDRVETIRGSGIQGVSQYKSSKEHEFLALIRSIGLGNENDERKLDVKTEAFYQRCHPPPPVKEVMCPSDLHRTVLSSQSEALSGLHVRTHHPEPENLQNLILIGYQPHFDSKEEEDAYFPSSMSPFSKESIAAICAPKPFNPTKTFRDRSRSTGTLAKLQYSDRDFKNLKQHRPLKKITKSASEPNLRLLSDEYRVKPWKNRSTKSLNDVGDAPSIESFGKYIKECAGRDVIEGDHTYHIPNNLRSKMISNYFGICKYDQEEMGQKEEEGERKAREANFNDLLETMDEEDVGFLASELHDQEKARNRAKRLRKERTSEQSSHGEYVSSSGSEDCSAPVMLGQKRGKPSKSGKKKEKEKPSIAIQTSSAEDPDYEKEEETHPTIENLVQEVLWISSSEGSSSPSGIDVQDLTIRKRGRSRKPKVTNTSQVSNRGYPRKVRRDESSPSEEQPLEYYCNRDFLSGTSNGKKEEPTIEEVREEVKKVKEFYRKKMVEKQSEIHRKTLANLREEMLTKWGPEQIAQLNEYCLQGRLNSTIPFEPRYFLPGRKIHATLKFGRHFVPVAIQRSFTRLGTDSICHVKLNRFDYCMALAGKHCDIVRDSFSDIFYLTASKPVIVDGVVVRNGTSDEHDLMRCKCQDYMEQLTAHQSNRGIINQIGVVKLNDKAQIKIGCTSFSFEKYTK